jgi:predicted ATPase
VLNNLGKTDPDQKDRLIEYLSQIVPGIHKVEREPMGPMESLNFLQKMGNSKTSKKFWAFSMSDGTLRALGVLTALFQVTGRKHLLSLVAIEEPEMALHPGASGVLFDALREASEERQVLVTSHSPELLDRKDIDAESILAVIQDDEETKIGKLTEGKKNLLKRQISTAGELLRQNQLRPDLRAIPSSAKLQMKLKF